MEVDTEESSEKQRKINLTLLNGTGYIFDVEDYLFLRRNYRIVGSMVGTPSNHVLGTDDATMPVELSTYETNLLVEKGFALLISKAESILRARKEPPSVDSTEESQSPADKTTESSENDSPKNFNSCSHETSSLSDHDIKPVPEQNLIQIHCAHPTKHFGKIVGPPPVDSFKYQVFEDLWSRGNYITGGDSFGADFLIYPGDPMQFHASHVVMLLREPRIDPLDMISKVRIATVVNKHCVFAYLAPGKNGLEDELRYQTVLWEGDHNEDEY